MNEQQVIDLINQWIIENHNNEITANVLNPILIAMIQQPNLIIGDLGDLGTEENDNLVDAINWILTQISNGNITIHTGQNNPNDTPPASYAVGDLYSQLDVMNNPLYLWQYTGTEWARISNYIDDDSISIDTTWSSQKISEAIQGDRFTQLGTLTWDENQVTASVGYEWVILGGQYLLTSEWQNTIPYTSALGFSRKDIIVAVQGNSFARIQGEEGTGIVEAPPLPPNTLLVSEFDVYHDSIGEPTNPTIGIFNRVVDIPFSEFGDDWANVTKENVAEKINDLEITQAQNEVHYFVVDDSVTPPPIYNFDVESVDWTDTPYGDLTLIENFEIWLAAEMGMTSIDITDFTSSETRIQCNIAYDTMLNEVLFLSLGITQVHNVTFLKEDLEGLFFEDNNLTEIPTISHLTSLTKFILNQNNISDIDNLEYHPSLIHLELGWNNISSLLGLSGLMNIEELFISYNNISSLTGLDNLINISYIRVTNNNITTAGWEDGLTWAQNVIENGGVIYTANNSDSITGTDIETELLSKNWTIY